MKQGSNAIHNVFITSSSSILFIQTVDKYGGVDILVSNAGVIEGNGPMLDVGIHPKSHFINR